jgi:hypothetical protein
MDPLKVAMLNLTADTSKMSPEMAAKANDPKWWAKLQATTEDKLDEEQKAMLGAMGYVPPEPE